MELEHEFNEWYQDLEGFHLRCERVWEELDIDSRDQYFMLNRWLLAAFEAGAKAAYKDIEKYVSSATNT